MEITGRTRVCGLLGDPVSESRSPFIQNMLAELCGYDLLYACFRVADHSPAAVEQVLRGAYNMNVLGLNATLPLKSLVIPYLAEVDPMAAKIGALNTLVRTEGGFKGYNTDIIGLEKDLTANGISPAGRNVLIFGAGGAARGAAFWTAEKAPARIIIANRTVEKARALAQDVKKANPACHVEACSLEEVPSLPDRYLVIQCSSGGFGPNAQVTPVQDPSFFEKVDFAYDVIYIPNETKFLRQAKAAGVPCSNGLRMLLGTAVAAFELWTGLDVPKSVEEKVCESLLNTVNT
ncbi:MAG: shikimate dehydrogenase [Lachnospiraceae bacterium]|nr:shikimate dehydrogenase [Lachnospiraceae bacterium]